MRISRMVTPGLAIAATLTMAASTAMPASQAASRARSVTSATAAVHGDPRAGQIIAIARHIKRADDLHAVIVGVWIDGRPLVVSAMGQSITSRPATADMALRVGSVAIPLMVTVLLQLAQENRISLNDKISRWLPGVPHARQVTLGELAASRSGYYDYVRSPALTRLLHANPFRYVGQRYLIRLGTTPPLRYPPGTSWNYAHTNWVLLGAALRKITGVPVATLLRRRTFDPLRLRDTTTLDGPYIRQPVLEAYDSERGQYEDSTYWNPSWTLATGSIMTSNIYDLGKIAIAIGTGRLLSRKSYREMIAPRSLITPPGKPKAYFGLGLFIDNSWIVQNPLFSGYNAAIAYLPSARIAIAVATTLGPRSSSSTNYSTGITRAIAKYLVPGKPLF